MSRDKIGELCCLYALGELAPEEAIRLQGHLCECEQCSALVKEFEKIILFDLPSIEVLRSEGSVPEDPESVSERELLSRIHERASSISELSREQPAWEDRAGVWPSLVPPLRTFRFAGLAALAAGWLVAAALILIHTATGPEGHKTEAAGRWEDSRVQVLKAEAAALTQELRSANANVQILKSKLDTMSDRARTAQFELAYMKGQNRSLNSGYSDLHTQLTQEEGLVEQESAELQLTRDNLNAQLAAKDSLEGQLSEVSSRLEKQSQEVARLARVAAAVPVAYSISESTVSKGEAREILGARDLHIVDVHDVDDSGKASRTYGRIYYVNHSELIFYAFDLSKLEKKHKLVAFQAWGFQQPQSSKVESLGLFYLDNATLNRWALRISNPEILSRIDTLFVTVEPPGGSRFPKGRRLLMASLVGPPNHP